MAPPVLPDPRETWPLLSDDPLLPGPRPRVEEPTMDQEEFARLWRAMIPTVDTPRARLGLGDDLVVPPPDKAPPDQWLVERIARAEQDYREILWCDLLLVATEPRPSRWERRIVKVQRDYRAGVLWVLETLAYRVRLRRRLQEARDATP